MPAKLKTVTAAVIGGALTTIAIPAASAQAAGNPGPAAPRLGSAAHPKAATPSAACGSTITWQDSYDNKYLEIYHSGTGNGDWADAHAGNGTCTQQWFAVASSSSPLGHALYGMVNTNSEKCLAAPDTNIGNTHIRQESCGHSQYNDRWSELADRGGFELNETYLNGKYLSNYGDVVAACEDVASANHWIYTSHWNKAVAAKNCIWH